jgi:hypothetical protein
MITITVPISTPDDKLRVFKEYLEHLVRYHPEYTGRKFLVEKSHISLVKVNGRLNSSDEEQIGRAHV